MSKYEFLEHPADLKIRSFGRDLPELFVHSALGMAAFLYGEKVETIKAAQTEKIEITAGNPESLLVDWLSELLFLSNVNHRAYIDFQVGELGECKIVAEVGSGHARAQDDIKAVTYHDLKIARKDGGYEAVVVYDI